MKNSWQWVKVKPTFSGCEEYAILNSQGSYDLELYKYAYSDGWILGKIIDFDVKWVIKLDYHAANKIARSSEKISKILRVI